MELIELTKYFEDYSDNLQKKYNLPSGIALRSKKLRFDTEMGGLVSQLPIDTEEPLSPEEIDKIFEE